MSTPLTCTGRPLARRASWGLWLAVAGCAEPTPAPEPVGCDVYAKDLDLLAACVRLEALNEDQAPKAQAACDELPPPRNIQCRSEWVATRSDHQAADRAALLEMCGGAPDCQFGVLDALPAGTYPAEVNDCTSLAGPFEADCIGHAAQRFLKTNPTDALLAEAVLLPHGERLAGMVPGYLACSGRTTCPDLGPVTAFCVNTMARQPTLGCANTSPEGPAPRR